VYSAFFVYKVSSIEVCLLFEYHVSPAGIYVVSIRDKADKLEL
jgi:hypothetical protein